MALSISSPNLSFQKNLPKVASPVQSFVIDQHDMNMQIFSNITDKTNMGKVCFETIKISMRLKF